MMSAAPIGASRAARRPAIPCKYAAAAAASSGAAPWARSEPARPDSTSPEPAVASQLEPVGLTRTGWPGSGRAMSVVDPFSRTVTPSWAAAAVA